MKPTVMEHLHLQHQTPLQTRLHYLPRIQGHLHLLLVLHRPGSFSSILHRMDSLFTLIAARVSLPWDPRSAMQRKMKVMRN
jgi:hypothetical protein